MFDNLGNILHHGGLKPTAIFKSHFEYGFEVARFRIDIVFIITFSVSTDGFLLFFASSKVVLDC